MSVLFIQSWLSMQLIEYFIWSKKFSNRLLSQIAFLLVASQPIIGILSISNHTFIKYIALVGYLLFVIVTMLIKPWSKIDFTSVKGPNGHLSWKWLDYSISLLLIWFMFLSIKFVVMGEWFILSLLTISLAITYALYHNSLTWGSLWCWFANLASFFIIAGVFYDDVCIYLDP